MSKVINIKIDLRPKLDQDLDRLEAIDRHIHFLKSEKERLLLEMAEDAYVESIALRKIL